MKYYYCVGCERNTGHKRFLGLGTFLALLATAGLWILAIPFYPKRCVLCGMKEGDEDERKSYAIQGGGSRLSGKRCNLTYLAYAFLIIVISFCLIISLICTGTDSRLQILPRKPAGYKDAPLEKESEGRRFDITKQHGRGIS